MWTLSLLFDENVLWPSLHPKSFCFGIILEKYIPVKYVVRHFLKHVGLRINKRLIQERTISLYSMSETYPFEVCRETFSKACRFKNQQTTISGEKPYPCTVCHRHIPVKNVVRHFLKHVGLGINKNENEFSIWVSLGIFLFWSVNHSFQIREELTRRKWLRNATKSSRKCWYAY